MKLLYTPTNDFRFTAYSVNTLRDLNSQIIGIMVSYSAGADRMNITVTAEEILKQTLESTFQDGSTYYVAFTEGALGFTYINKFVAMTYPKQSGLEYLRIRNMQVPIQIYIPWGGNSLKDATIRVCGPGVPALGGVPFDVDTCVEANEVALQAVDMKSLPRLRSPDSAESPVKAQLMLGGVEHARAGVLVVAQLTGSLVTASAMTDEYGIVSFKAPPGETVELGFRDCLNITRTLVK